ncbi:MAG: glycosyltransferase family 39 protein [Nitrospirae bacterium]|nr:glycosyltransferase family 39 protein [Nitrospirota bacterium]
MKTSLSPENRPKRSHFLNGPAGIALLIGLPTVLRFFLVGRFDLGNDEAHYYMYAAHPDFSFFDHPLMIGLLISRGMEWWGHSEFGVRFFAPVLFLLSSLIFSLIAWRLFPSWNYVLTVLVLLNAVPLFGLLGSTLMLPDDPLSVFWLLYLLVFLEAVRVLPGATPLGRAGVWGLLGAIFGLALLSKYNAVLLPVITFGILLREKTLRPMLCEPGPWAGLVLGFVIAWPLFYWNWLHHGASFLFQVRHGMGGFSFNWVSFYQMVLGQVGYVSPILWGMILVSFFIYARSLRRSARPEERLPERIVLWFSLVPLVFFNSVGIFHPILPHWPALGYMSGLLLLGAVYRRSGPGSFRRWTRAGVVLGIGMTMLVLLQVTTNFFVLPEKVPDKVLLTGSFPYLRARYRPVPRWVDITNDLFGFKRLARHLQREGDTDSGKWAFYDSDHFNTADELAFYLHAPGRTLCLEPGTSQFDFWTSPSQFLGKNGIFVSTDKYPTDPRTLYPDGTFRKIVPEPPYAVYRRGHLARIFYVYRMTGLVHLPWQKGENPP